MCHLRCTIGEGGAEPLLEHVRTYHVSTKVSADGAQRVRGMLEICGCGTWVESGRECGNCGGSSGARRAVRAGDVVPKKETQLRPAVPRAEQRRARVAREAAIADFGIVGDKAWIERLRVEDLRPVAEELEKWSGSETTVHIPRSLRPEIAEMVGALLNGMVDGSEAASLMLRCFAKLILHQAEIRDKTACSVIRKRLAMLRQNRIGELVTNARSERLRVRKSAGKRDVNGSKRDLGKVKEMAREGALSKAVRRLRGMEVMRYPDDELLRWARTLIPGTTVDERDLGARIPSEAERRGWRQVRTCAAKIGELEKEDEEGEAGVAGGQGGDRDDETDRKTVKVIPKTNAYAEGVRFQQLSAPGPSGLRPEHLKELATATRARSRQVFARAMSRFVAAGISGRLPEVARWITDSAVTFVRKPGAADGAAPRPLRVGEVLRRWIAKRIVVAERDMMRKLFARRRQFGVACPGGAEILLHHRMMTCGGADGSVGDWDVDLKNCYGNLYWGAIDVSVQKHIPGALPWTRWLHGAGSRVILPGGVVHESDRGAEQGDPLGGAYAAAVIIDVCEEAESRVSTLKIALGSRAYTSERMCEAFGHVWTETAREGSDGRKAVVATRRAEVERKLTEVGAWPQWNSSGRAGEMERRSNVLRLMDVWYIDDGHVRADLVDGDMWLMAFDAAGSGVGIIRSDTKSLFAAPSADTPTPPYTHAMCQRREQGAAVKYLGVEIGREDGQFGEKVAEMQELHQRIGEIDDPALELLLKSRCADVSKVMHLLRAVGPVTGEDGDGRLTTDRLSEMDKVMAAALTGIVRMEPTEEAIQQASWSVGLGGLGFRPGTRIALPAHVASIVEARPMVEWLSESVEERGLPVVRRIHDVVTRVRDKIRNATENGATEAAMVDWIKKADERVSKRASEVLGIQMEEDDGGREGGARGTERQGEGEDPGGGGGGRKLQHDLVQALEREQFDRVVESLAEVDGDGARIRRARLIDLANRETKHGWLEAVNRAQGPVLLPQQYITAVRLRLGLAVTKYAGSAECAECGREKEDHEIGNHALCCAKGRSVQGHNKIRDILADLARVSDGGTSTEEGERVIGQDGREQRLRPADVLTNASPFGGVGSAALDIGICCPHTAAAIARRGGDVLEEYKETKMRKNDAAAKQLGWTYKPMTISCYGRPHSDTVRAVRQLASAAARRYGEENVKRIEDSWWKKCSTLLAERAANMVMKCSPSIPLPRVLGGRADGDEDEIIKEGGGGEVDVDKVVTENDLLLQ